MIPDPSTIHPFLVPPLDPGFVPLTSRLDQRDEPARGRTGAIPVTLALQGSPDGCAHWTCTINRSEPDPALLETLRHQLKFLMWSRGGATLYIDAPEPVGRALAALFSDSKPLQFDARLMERVYGRPFTIQYCDRDAIPPEQTSPQAMGGHDEGCRLGFDLGASDYKIAAVRDGAVVFSAEFPWKPSIEPDPAYHYHHLNQGLRQAAARLPRVDAIGGSSAGIIVGNKIRVASLFRAVPAHRFESDVAPFFERLQQEWGVPVAVANDGDVTALAGAQSLQRNGVLGIAMGSSEAAGYIDPQGRILGWLNELAFAPVDGRSDAPRDEWSGAPGVGAQYFSQQAVNRLLPAAGISLPPDMPLPERLLAVQRLADAGDPRAIGIFTTIGCYLGHTLPLYRRFYDFGDVLVLGRVTSGAGGEVLLENARGVLRELYKGDVPFRIQVPDEKMRRVGQAVTAASLPASRSLP